MNTLALNLASAFYGRDSNRHFLILFMSACFIHESTAHSYLSDKERFAIVGRVFPPSIINLPSLFASHSTYMYSREGGAGKQAGRQKSTAMQGFGEQTKVKSIPVSIAWIE